MKRLKYIILWLLLIVMAGCQNNKGDRFWLSQAASCIETYPDSALLLLKKIYDPKVLSSRQQADYCLLLTQAMDKKNLPITTDSLIKVSVSYYERQAESLNKGKAFFYWGRFYSEAKKVVEAQRCFQRAKKVLDATEDYKYRALSRAQLARLYLYQDLYQDALRLNRESLSLFRLLGDSSMLPYALRDVGRCYLLKGSLDSASFYYQDAIDVALQLNDHKKYSGINAEWTGALWRMGKSDNVEKVLLQSLSSVSDKYPIYFNLGSYYLSNNSYQQAEFYLLKATKSFQPYTRLAAYKKLRDLEVRDFNLPYSRQYEIVSDSLTNIRLSSEMKEIEEKYKNERLLKENLLLYNAKLYTTVLSLSAILILIGLFVFVYCLYRREKRIRGNKERTFARQVNENEYQIKQLLDARKVALQKISALQQSVDGSSIELQKEEKRVCELKIQIEQLQSQTEIYINNNRNLFHANKQMKHALSLLKISDPDKNLNYHSALHILILVLTEPNYSACDQLTSEDWCSFFDLIDLIQGGSLRKRLPAKEAFSDIELCLCYLVLIGVKQSNQTLFLGVTMDALVKRKQRLRAKIGFDSSTPFDKLILNL
ncbi:tetratricopeptide repeat protein [Bacteroides neonati]|uniref:tetratricopeptide repeat protein n=1 Tax=Bacteroides neonati TaxID=1347393 RepID=UPI0004B764F3|nr:tetratricopeptide repeat protein [Bacteroides neonati]